MNVFMQEAIKQAKKAKTKNEVPIGAVVVKNGKIISKAHNKREKKQNALMHAELLAIHKACKKLHSWRLDECEIYVTLEPCPMCAGAISNSRIKRVVFGAFEKTSGDHLLEQILSSPRLNHKTKIFQDKEAEDECACLLTSFFKQKRQQKEEV